MSHWTGRFLHWSFAFREDAVVSEDMVKGYIFLGVSVKITNFVEVSIDL